MTEFAVLLSILLLFVVPVPGLLLLCRWLRTRWIDARQGCRVVRIVIVFAGAAAISSPYVIFKACDVIYKAHDLSLALSRVPEPLRVSQIEYRLEKSWGVGMPGDNETGFVVYRMTVGSTEWARSQGQKLGAMLQGDSSNWRPTPVDESSTDNNWHAANSASPPHSHRANVREYLDKYGFSIALESGRDTEINDAIQHPGSFYSYGRGGSVTVIDPRRGKIYFAYAG